MAKHTISQDALKELVHYNPETGIFTWAKSRVRCRKGHFAGTVSSDKRVRIGLNRTRFLAHRLAFIYMTGECPEEVDHINGEVSDNRWCNLREVTHAENMRNMKRHCTNQSGHMGVRFIPRLDKWRAEIWCGKNIYLGVYKTKPEAIAARKSAEKMLNFHENHGRHK